MDQQLLNEISTIFGMYEDALVSVLEVARMLQVNAELNDKTKQEVGIKELTAKSFVTEAKAAEQNLYKKYGVTVKENNVQT